MSKGWREEKKAQLKLLLYQTALDLFREQGYQETSIRQITQRAKVGKGTFFNHYPSKEHLLAEWYRLCDEEAFAACQGREYANAREAITTMITTNMRKILLDKDLFIAKTQIVYRDSLISDEEKAQDSEYFNFCLAHLRKDKRNGRIDAGLDEAFFADLIITLATGTSRRWVYQGGDFDMVESIEKDLAFIFSAVEKEC